MRLHSAVILTGLLTMPLLAAAAQDALPTPKVTTAQMGDIQIGGERIDLVKATMSPENRARFDEDDAFRRKVLQEELLKDYLVRQARQEGFDKEPEVVVKVNLSADQTLSLLYLEEQSKPKPDFPSETLLKEAFEKNKDAMREPTQVHLAQIYLSNPEKASVAQAREVRENIYKLFKEATASPKKFSELAKNKSDHKESAAKGGDMGWVTINSLTPSMLAVVESMLPGEISSPVRGNKGWHLIKMLEVKTGKPLTFEQARSGLTNLLRRQAWQDGKQNLINRILKEHPVTFATTP